MFRIVYFHLLRIALYGELSTEHRNRVASRKRQKGFLYKYLCVCHIDHDKLLTIGASRKARRHTTHQAVSAFEGLVGQDSRSRGCLEIVEPLHQSQSRLSLEVTATGLASHELVSSVISVHAVDADDVEKISCLIFVCEEMPYIVSLHLYRFICKFLTKAASCRNIEIVLYPKALSYIYLIVPQQ